jgi:small glutamine-rich tetratricopeptide repeat-containing protein alpha
MKNGLRTCEAQPAETVEEAAPRSAAASSNPLADVGSGGLGGLADTLRNMGGGGAGAGAGGMPDLASMMSNPAVMQMAQQMMTNGGLERLMSTPGVSNMVSGIDSSRCVDISPYVACSFYQMDQLNSGGSLPSMEDLMTNPELRQL